MERKDFEPALLPSKGLNERRATVHVYSHSEEIELKNEQGTPIRGIAHFYRCTETGELRRWGFNRISADKGN